MAATRPSGGLTAPHTLQCGLLLRCHLGHPLPPLPHRQSPTCSPSGRGGAPSGRKRCAGTGSATAKAGVRL
eukprot:7252987-Alexandrium_andersonii.AAC.1